MVLPGLQDPRLIRLHDYWASKIGSDGTLPCREDLDPRGMGAAVLPWVILLDVVETPKGRYCRRYRYRVVGTEVVARFGFDPTGKHVDDLGDTEMIRLVHRYMDEAVTSRQASVTQTPFMGPDREFLTTERLILPLRDKDRDCVAKLIVVPLA
jgi:hypothetical protein